MHFIKPILYLLITPFTPNWTFKQFDKSNKKTNTVVITFLLSLIILAISYAPIITDKNYIPPDYESYVVGFLIGFALRNLILGYLLWLSINRTLKGKMSWSNSFAIVSFSQLPILLGVLLPIYFREFSDIVHYIGLLWNATIMAIGLKFFNKISIAKSVLLVFAIIVTQLLVTLVFNGIRLPPN